MKHFTSESVTEGHPDKVCDQVSDGILDALLEQDPMSRCACEVTCEPGAVHIMGEITTAAKVNYEAVAREVIRDIGYTKPEYGFDCDTCEITVSLHEQSPDIAMGVDHAMDMGDGDEGLGAGDQGMMFGYACDETPELMPLPITLANGLTYQMAQARKQDDSILRPDGKSQVTVRYEGGKPVGVDTIVLAAQHNPGMGDSVLYDYLSKYVIDPVMDRYMGELDMECDLYINATGQFVLGGPAADTGLTGRKIMVDTYGGMARHGGGAFSGKDPTKVDRSGAYMARYVAKNIVASGLASRCEVSLAYSIGVADPVSVEVDTFGTCAMENDKLLEIVRDCFDFRPSAIIRNLDLRRPIYLPLASYGHFGKTTSTWELTDKAEMLLEAAD